jgi:hypothetical protein
MPLYKAIKFNQNPSGDQTIISSEWALEADSLTIAQGMVLNEEYDTFVTEMEKREYNNVQVKVKK